MSPLISIRILTGTPLLRRLLICSVTQDSYLSVKLLRCPLMSIVTISVSNRRTGAKIGFQEKSLYFVNNGGRDSLLGLFLVFMMPFFKKKRVSFVRQNDSCDSFVHRGWDILSQSV